MCVCVCGVWYGLWCVYVWCDVCSCVLRACLYVCVLGWLLGWDGPSSPSSEQSMSMRGDGSRQQLPSGEPWPRVIV